MANGLKAYDLDNLGVWAANDAAEAKRMAIKESGYTREEAQYYEAVECAPDHELWGDEDGEYRTTVGNVMESVAEPGKIADDIW